MCKYGTYYQWCKSPCPYGNGGKRPAAMRPGFLCTPCDTAKKKARSAGDDELPAEIRGKVSAHTCKVQGEDGAETDVKYISCDLVICAACKSDGREVEGVEETK